MTTHLDQLQMFYAAHDRLADQNEAFLELVSHSSNPMTNDDLRKLVERHPDRYGRFAHFIGKLGDEVDVPDNFVEAP